MRRDSPADSLLGGHVDRPTAASADPWSTGHPLPRPTTGILPARRHRPVVRARRVGGRDGGASDVRQARPAAASCPGPCPRRRPHLAGPTPLRPDGDPPCALPAARSTPPSSQARTPARDRPARAPHRRAGLSAAVRSGPPDSRRPPVTCRRGRALTQHPSSPPARPAQAAADVPTGGLTRPAAPAAAWPARGSSGPPHRAGPRPLQPGGDPLPASPAARPSPRSRQERTSERDRPACGPHRRAGLPAAVHSGPPDPRHPPATRRRRRVLTNHPSSPPGRPAQAAAAAQTPGGASW